MEKTMGTTSQSDHNTPQPKPGTRHNGGYRVLTKLAFELVTIVAGILIALFVNDIQERKHDREVLNSTLIGLSTEFQKNVENINTLQPKLLRFRDTLDYYKKNVAISIYEITTKAPGLAVADLYNTNWQVTLSSNSLRLLSFETVTLLSKIDSKHQELKEQRNALYSMIYNTAIYKTGNEGMDHRKLLGVWLGGYLSDERELIALYQQFNALISRKV